MPPVTTTGGSTIGTSEYQVGNHYSIHIFHFLNMNSLFLQSTDFSFNDFNKIYIIFIKILLI